MIDKIYRFARVTRPDSNIPAILDEKGDYVDSKELNSEVRFDVNDPIIVLQKDLDYNNIYFVLGPNGASWLSIAFFEFTDGDKDG